MSLSHTDCYQLYDEMLQITKQLINLDNNVWCWRMSTNVNGVVSPSYTMQSISGTERIRPVVMSSLTKSGLDIRNKKNKINKQN